ncbi:ribosomal protection-like ABC-F family protein [Candidatus Riflebacteria bacterium]
MSSIILKNVCFHYFSPYVSVFENLTLNIDLTWRTALVGRNGMGKTTLLQLLHGKIQPVKGLINVPVTTNYFPYKAKTMEQLTMQVVKDAVAPFSTWELKMQELSLRSDEQGMDSYANLLQLYEEHGGYEIEASIEKEFVEMGLDTGLLLRNFSGLSEGEKTRALIIPLFLQKSGFPLIDEPTNHLDMQGRLLLGNYLAKKRGFILVSHDRTFLDSSVNHVLSLNKSDTRIHRANFSQWKYQMEMEEDFEKRRKENLKREIKHLKRAASQRRVWSDKKEKEKIGAGDKGRIGHLAAKQMKRALCLERRLKKNIVEKKGLLKNEEKKRVLKLESCSKSPELLLSLSNALLCMGERILQQKINLKLYRGERIAITGANGTGKTTLFRAICAEHPLTEGHLYFPARLKILRVQQEPTWNQGFLQDYLLQSGIDEKKFRTIMGSLGVAGEIFTRPLESFSEGQRKKVELCKSFLQPGHLLLWDEPLNYIDLFSREQIENAVLKFCPSLLFIEHDRAFVEKVATHILELKP